MKSCLKVLRRGFVLPLSLIVTFITVTIIGASATYCTTQLKTSRLYLNRTQYRLVAQSAIELAKLQLLKECSSGRLLKGISDPANHNYMIADFSDMVAVLKNSTELRQAIERIPGKTSEMQVVLDMKAGKDADEKSTGINLLLATVSSSRSGTSVTLQEGFKAPIASANLFLYAYLANGDGHLTSRYLTVNGDVRANGKFHIAGAEINGFVYATNGVNLAQDESQPARIRTAASYNQTYRSGSYKTGNYAYPKSRPTNPLGDTAKTPWAGGFDSVEVKSGTYQTLATNVTTRSGKKVFNVYEHGVVLPQIENYSKFQEYKNYAATKFKNSRGETGGRLSCSNCYENGKSIAVKLRFTSQKEAETVQWQKYVTKEAYVDPPGTVKVGEETQTEETTEETKLTREEAQAFIGEHDNYIAVYEYIDYKTYKNKSSSEKQKWTQMSSLRTGYRNTSKSTMLFKGDLSGVATTFGKSTTTLLGAMRQQDSGWSTTETTSGYYSKLPIAYVAIDYNDPVIDYKYVKLDTGSDPGVTGKGVPAYNYISYTEYNKLPTGKDKWTRCSSGYRNPTTKYYFSESDASAWGLSEDTVEDYFEEGHGWTEVSYGYRSTAIAGYLYLTFSTDKYGRKTISKVTFQELKPEPTEEDLPEGTIPVYECISKSTYDGKSNTEKAKWKQINGTGNIKTGYHRNADGTNPELFFDSTKLTLVASQLVSENPKVKEMSVTGKITENGWQGNYQGTKTYYGGKTSVSYAYYSVKPVGYIELGVSGDAKLDYSYTLVLNQTVSKKTTKETKVPIYNEESIPHDAEYGWKLPDGWKLPEGATLGDRDANGVSTVTFPPKQVDVDREIRGIFVQKGHYIDATGSYVPAEDLKIKSGVTLGAGSDTKELRPFRENDGEYKCNAETSKKGEAADQGAVILIGTWNNPICIDGPVVFESDVLIRGFVSGRGTIYSGRNIHIIGDINYKDPPFWPDNNGAKPNTKDKDLLVLVARGSIIIGNYVEDDMWKNMLLNTNYHYIDGQKNTNDPLAERPYTDKNYLEEDRLDGKNVYKTVFTTSGFEVPAKTRAKCYESVVGDYVFRSKFTSEKDNLDVSGALSTYGCSSPISQRWTCNIKNNLVDSKVTDTVLQYVQFYSHSIDRYVTEKTSYHENGMLDVSFSKAIWGQTFKTYFDDKFARSDSTTSTKPRVAFIQSINAVLYSCGVLCGVAGGTKTPCIINGAVVGHDEALCPFIRDRYRRDSTDDVTMTINWDIRLSSKSQDSLNNKDPGELGVPMAESSDSEGTVKEFKILSWQEVPDSFNEEYHATP